tara:strand:+ start:90726 stop:90947 length:222 start_codon:yes stop_codon:yes gene_type:complete
MNSEYFMLMLFVVMNFILHRCARVAIYLREGHTVVKQSLCVLTSQLRPKNLNLSVVMVQSGPFENKNKVIIGK